MRIGIISGLWGTRVPVDLAVKFFMIMVKVYLVGRLEVLNNMAIDMLKYGTWFLLNIIVMLMAS